MSDAVQDPLQSYCRRAFPLRQRVRIDNLTALSQGWESEMYAFDLSYGPARERKREGLILRIYPGDDAYEKSLREFQAMGKLYQAGYPVPQVMLLERDRSPFGRPFMLMERVEGRPLWPLLFTASGAEQQRFLTQFCALFVRLHALDWRPFTEDVGSYVGEAYAFVDRWVSRAGDVLAGFPGLGLGPVVEWLAARRDEVPCPRPALVHWDFHPYNILVRQDGSAVVIDWTGVDVSDWRFDLAWTLVLINSYEGAEWRERILGEYERLSGAQVEELAFFEVAACARRLFSVAASLSGGAERLGMRPGAEAVMRQQMGALRRVYDMLQERTGLRLKAIEALLTSG